MFIHELDEDEVFGRAAEMAYRFLFAIFPFLLFMVSALGFVGAALNVGDLFDGLLRQTEPFLPAEVSDIISQYLLGLLNAQSTTFLTIGLLGTLWGATGGVEALIKGLNHAYDVERARPFWRRRILAVLVTLSLPPAGLALFTLAVLGRQLAQSLGKLLGLEREIVTALELMRWPFLFLTVFFGLSLLYHILPNVNHRYLWSLPGSAFATIAWLLITEAFEVYLASFGNYDSTYGSFGAAIAFLLWLYVIGVIVLVGAEINALLEPTQRKSWLGPQAGT